MLKSVFGLPVRYEVWENQNALPVYLTGSYEFHTAYIADKHCIMIRPTDELANLPALRKQIAKIQQIDNVPVVLELTTLSTYRRKSLLENNIPFVTEKQIFLPFIGTILTDEKELEKLTGKFVFSTQQLFLLYLYRGKKQLYVAEAGRQLPFTAMTLTRAVRQLEASGLFNVFKNGVSKIIESKYNKQELFERAKSYLSSPVYKTGYIEKSQITPNMVFAGETALAEKTMLNPGRVTTYAVSEKEFNKIFLTQELVDPEKQVRLELWAYDPRLFSRDNTADSLSVALSFSENTDERIEETVAELLRKELGE